MKYIVILSLLGGLFSCSSQHSHEHSHTYHSHGNEYESEANLFEQKELNSLFVLANGELQSRVSFSQENGFMIIKANNIPNHETGNFARGRNPNTIKEQDKTYKVTLKPTFADKPTKSFPNAFGVALNGVFFEPSTAEFWRGNQEWNQEAINGKGQKLLGLDENYAHVQPDGSYHYHGTPIGLLKELSKKNKNKMMLVGYAADGFPIYSQYGYTTANDSRSRLKKLKSSYRLKRGKRPSNAPSGRYDGTYTADYEYVKGLGDLDEFNGRSGVTPEYPKGIYYYVVTTSFPFMSRSWKGTPDPSFFKRGGQGPMRDGPGERKRPPRPGERPPPRF
ncbi:MAG: YHYH protein [Lentisphaeraceae bacterium]|nr:YHYH protein [Lentisphaeraceae bacterium]